MVWFQLLRYMASLIISLMLNVPVLLSNVLRCLTAAATDNDVPVFSTYLGNLCSYSDVID